MKNELLKKRIFDYMKVNSKENEQALAKALSSSDLIVPASWDKEPFIDEKGQKSFHENTQFELRMLQAENGDTYLPVFTDINEFKKWGIDTKNALVLSFAQYHSFVEMSKNQVKGVVINPFDENNLPLDVDFVLSIQ